jgi:hypothetical protein
MGSVNCQQELLLLREKEEGKWASWSDLEIPRLWFLPTYQDKQSHFSTKAQTGSADSGSTFRGLWRSALSLDELEASLDEFKLALRRLRCEQ